jgi:GWxTD domain-containing protein
MCLPIATSQPDFAFHQIFVPAACKIGIFKYGMRLHRTILPACLIIVHGFVMAQVKADMRPMIFFAPQTGPYLETNLTVLGNSVSRQRIDSRWQNSLNITTRIWQDSSLVKAERYNLHGPFYTDSTNTPSFIDCQRYVLPNGRYQVEMILKDFNSASGALTIRSDVTINFREKLLSSSRIQPLEKFSKAVATGPLTKSGFDVVPYNSDFFPQQVSSLGFYWEVYHSSEAVGAGEPVVLEWFLENAADSMRLSSYGGSGKQAASSVNVLLARADLNALGNGQYALVTQLKDRRNLILQQEKYYFTRHNNRVDIASLQALSVKEREHAFVGNCNNADTLRMFVECLWPIADNVDKEKIVTESVKKDRESMKSYLVDFWQRRAADTGNPVKMWGNYYRQVQQAMVMFRCGKQNGYYTDRGRVFLQYGPPNARTEQINEPNTFPYEIWQYYRTTDATNGHFYSNRKFVFVNKNLGDNCHTLVHSDTPGEVINPRWQYEVTRRNSSGISNPDREAPATGTQDNQFREIFQNPR